MEGEHRVGESKKAASRELQLLSLEQTMTNAVKNTCCRWVTMFVICIVIPGCLLAQSDAAKNTNGAKPDAVAPAPVANLTASTSATQPHDDTYTIGADDVLAISVWKEPDVSRTVPVRSDGKISLPLAGEVQASGQTPKQLEKALAAKLQGFISEPEVTVIVAETRSQKFNILGMVLKPGTYPLTNGATVLDAIAIAGGFRDFAKQKSIYVLRQAADGGQTRLPFNYKEVIKGKDSTQNIKLLPRDTVVVP